MLLALEFVEGVNYSSTGCDEDKANKNIPDSSNNFHFCSASMLAKRFSKLLSRV